MGSLGGENGGKSKHQPFGTYPPALPSPWEWRLGKSYRDGTFLLSKSKRCISGWLGKFWTLPLRMSGLLALGGNRSAISLGLPILQGDPHASTG